MGEKNQKEIRFLAFFVLLRRRRSILVAFFFFLERLNARRRRARRHLYTNRSARAQRQKAVASCRRTRCGETPARRLGVLRETKDDRRFWVKDHCFIPLQTKEEVENRGIFYQKPPFKNEEKREKQRTHRCEQRGGGGRGDGRLGELLRQVGRLDRLVDRTVSKGEERAIGERAAKRFIRGEAFITAPKTKEDKILMMMDEEEKKRTIKKKENRNSPKGSNARSPTYRLDETFAEVICLPAKVADCIERAILVVCACLVRLYMTRLRMGKIDLYSRTSKRASF